MRKLLVPLLAVAALAAAGVAAGGSSKTVTISKTGYTPTAVSITTGDAVVFKNTDTVAHTVKLNSTTGVNCGAAVPLVIAAAGERELHLLERREVQVLGRGEQQEGVPGHDHRGAPARLQLLGHAEGRRLRRQVDAQRQARQRPVGPAGQGPGTGVRRDQVDRLSRPSRRRRVAHSATRRSPRRRRRTR